MSDIEMSESMTGDLPFVESNGKAKPKPDKTVSLDKYDAQKRILQKMVLSTLDRGEASGLKKTEVQTLREALLVLGWLPSNLRL